MTTPNYKLKNDHGATIGHVRQAVTISKEYTDDEIQNLSLDQLLPCKGTYDMFNNNFTGLSNSTDPTSSATVNQLSFKADTSTVNQGLNSKLNISGGTMTGALVLNGDATQNLQPTTKQQVDTALATKKNTGTFDSKIENATAKTAFQCDTDRYVSIKSNGNKICDILEDEVNAGCTINTNNKRLNFVSQQPQTFYHNSGSGLFNLKYTDDGNTTAGQARFGQIQLAPSNTTNLNPAVTLASSRVNGLGTVGTLFLDSTYGNAQVPLIVAPQSLTDANSNTMTMYRTNSTLPAGTPKTVFSQSVGYVNGVTPTESSFVTKQYVDSAISGTTGGITQTQADARYLQLAGGTLTGNLILSGPPTQDLHASTKAYVDSRPTGTGDLKADGTVAMTGNLNMGGFKLTNVITGANDNESVNLGYVNSQIGSVNGSITTLTNNVYSKTDAEAKFVDKTTPLNSLTAPSGNLSMNSKKITGLADGLVSGEAIHRGQFDLLTASFLTQNQADVRYYLKTQSLSDILPPIANLNLNNKQIINLADPTTDQMGATKKYVDTQIALSAGQSGSFIQDPSQVYKLSADSDSFNMRSSGSSFMQFKPSQLNLSGANLAFISLNNSALSNQFSFYSTGVPSLNRFDIINFVNGSARTSRLNSVASGLTNVYIDLDNTNQQIIIPSTSKLIRTDTSTSNFQNNEYVTKAYAQTLVSGSISNTDASFLQLDTNARVSIGNSSSVVNPSGNGVLINALVNQISGKVTNSANGYLQLIGDVGYVDGQGIVQSGQLIIGAGNQYTGTKSYFIGSVGYSSSSEQITQANQFPHKKYVDDGLNLKLNANTTLNSITAPTASLSMNSQKITNLADPTNNQDATTVSWVNQQLQNLGISSWPATYTIVLNLGDIPSSIESFSSTGDQVATNGIVASVVYTSQSSTQGYYRVNLNSLPFGTGKFETMFSWRSLRTGTAFDSLDNKFGPGPVCFNKSTLAFSVGMESQSNFTENVALIILLVPSPI